MKTIFAGLPFYSSITKQEYNRINSQIPYYTPATHLPSFQICDDVSEVPEDFDVYLIDKDGYETDIGSYFNVSPAITELTDYFYITYTGAALGTQLPKGTYHLRVDTSTGYSYFSEQFTIIDTSKGSWCKIEASNTNDLGDILYATAGFEQVYYLNTQLNYPANEVVEVGEEKDGEFIAEKLVTKHIYRISTYVNRALQRCLLRLPQHDSITITDDVGNVYTPSVGNVRITTDWPSFDVAHVVIQFNDGENTAFKWTYGMANMT